MISPLFAGELIRIRFGDRGSQTARVLQDCRPHEVKVKVSKFRRSSQRWTRPAWIYRQDVLQAPTVDPLAEASLETKGARHAMH